MKNYLTYDREDYELAIEQICDFLGEIELKKNWYMVRYLEEFYPETFDKLTCKMAGKIYGSMCNYYKTLDCIIGSYHYDDIAELMFEEDA